MGIGDRFEFEKTGRIEPEPTTLKGREMKHTPKPWVEYRKTSIYRYIGSAPVDAVASGVPTAQQGEMAVMPVCRVEQDMYAEANANLIIAAPDLLAACQLMMQKIDACEQEMLNEGLQPSTEERTEIATIRAAIAKATGQ